ncbi:uncharacterized protein YALI1_B03290g [Yarrowia lipolytica]|uniref:Uncharacterized protein n=1 Tax=Yarrowia lipolytica TaxID=4952 RepID=A0A1D8N647_YARLL|nr:hypothetical protein YALI1_B03290g [Yarrowia lipolytica]
MMLWCVVVREQNRRSIELVLLLNSEERHWCSLINFELEHHHFRQLCQLVNPSSPSTGPLGQPDQLGNSANSAKSANPPTPTEYVQPQYILPQPFKCSYKARILQNFISTFTHSPDSHTARQSTSIRPPRASLTDYSMYGC